MSSWQMCQKLATWRRTVLSLYTSHATFPFTFPLFPSNSSTFSYLTSSHVPIQTETQFHQNKTTRRKSIDVNLMGHAVENRRVRRPGCSFGASRRLGASRLPGWVRWASGWWRCGPCILFWISRSSPFIRQLRVSHPSASRLEGFHS